MTSRSSLEQDAIPEEARPNPSSSLMNSDMNNEIDDQTQRENTQDDLALLPRPPPDWHLNMLLLQIKNEMTDEDLKDMKMLLKGFGGVLDDMSVDELTTAEIFDQMRALKYFSRDNLIYLQTLLLKIRRKDLVLKCVDYSRHEKSEGRDILHFYTPPPEPAAGYKNVKFHVYGHYKFSMKDRLRSEISNILFVPPHSIFFVGIEPSGSLIITIMIPNLYVDILIQALKNDDVILDPLVAMSIDTVLIENETFTLKGSGSITHCETDEQAQLKILYAEIQKKNPQMKELQVQNLHLSREIEKLKKKQGISTEKHSIEQNCYRKEDEIEKLKKKQGISNEKHSIEQNCYRKEDEIETLIKKQGISTEKHSIEQNCYPKEDDTVSKNMCKQIPKTSGWSENNTLNEVVMKC